jgi:CDP-paratose 2-epimerase
LPGVPVRPHEHEQGVRRRPNTIRLRELPTRWDYGDARYRDGIPEEFSIDQSKHSVFGASKAAADIMVQELHGFISYLIRCNLEGRTYRIFGYKGKQVRDNIHSHDVVEFMRRFIDAPRAGEVYNLGGGAENSVSILEAFKLIESISGKPMSYEYLDKNREGDHICYYSNLSKLKANYPGWTITKDLRTTFVEIHESWLARTAAEEGVVRIGA